MTALDVTAQAVPLPHIAIEVNDIDAAIADLKRSRDHKSRGVDKAADLLIRRHPQRVFYRPNGEQLELLQHL